MSDDKGSKGGKGGSKEFPAQTFAEDMSDEWSKDAIKAARDAFALTIGKSLSAWLLHPLGPGVHAITIVL